MKPAFKRGMGSISNPAQFSANYKITEVAKRMGVSDLSKMQITTRQIYHALKLQTTTQPQTLTFFTNVNNTKFPFTNINDNKLQAGEAIAVERAYFSILQCQTGTSVIDDVYPLEWLKNFRPIIRSDFDLQIDRQTVTKKINVTSWYAPFNKDAYWAQFGQVIVQETANLYNYGHSIYHFDNSFVIIPQIEFSATITYPPVTLPIGYDYYLMLNLEGLGSLFNPKANY